MLPGMRSNKLKISPDGAKNPSEERANPIGDVAYRNAHHAASSVAYSNYGHEAFNGANGSSKWNPVKPGDEWIYWTFDEAIKCNKAIINAVNWAYFRIDASNDQTNWTTLYDYTSGSNKGEGYYVAITWINNTPYKTYRLYLYNMGNTYMGIDDIMWIENS